VSSGIGQELIFKGPLTPLDSEGWNRMGWRGVGGVTLGVGAWYAVQRRRKSFDIAPAAEDGDSISLGNSGVKEPTTQEAFIIDES